jgi:hypothetical protein
MTPETVLKRLHALGVSLRAEGETLRLRPLSAVPPDLLAEAKARKAELLALLRAAEPVPPPPPELPPGAADWLAARTTPEPGCCVGVGDAVADFLAHTPDGDPRALVNALAAGAVPGVRIAVTANSTRLVVGRRIGDCSVLNPTSGKFEPREPAR